MKRLLVIIALYIIVTQCSAQEFGQNVVTAQKAEIVPEYVHQKMDLGLGFGLDYGGVIGTKITYSPIKYLAVFGSIGYHIISVGWQTGVAGYVIPRTTQKVFRVYGKLMFGSNRVIVVDGASQYNDIYYGFTPGAGMEFRWGRTKRHGMNFDLNVPISSKRFQDDYEYLKNHTTIDLGPVSPVAISFGYHFVIF